MRQRKTRIEQTFHSNWQCQRHWRIHVKYLLEDADVTGKHFAQRFKPSAGLAYCNSGDKN